VGSPPDSTLTGRKLCTVRVQTLASPAYLSTHGAPRRPEDLAHHACIIDLNRREPYRWIFTSGKVAVRGRLAFSNASACLAAAEAGLGVTCVPDFVADTALAEERVLPLLTEYENQPLGVFALYPSGRHLPAKLRVLVDFMARALR